MCACACDCGLSVVVVSWFGMGDDGEGEIIVVSLLLLVLFVVLPSSPPFPSRTVMGYEGVEEEVVSEVRIPLLLLLFEEVEKEG